MEDLKFRTLIIKELRVLMVKNAPITIIPLFGYVAIDSVQLGDLHKFNSYHAFLKLFLNKTAFISNLI